MTLVLPPRLTKSAMAVRDAAERRGLQTVQLATCEVPENFSACHLHASPSFADVVAPALDIGLLEAPLDWLARLPAELARREIRLMPLSAAHTLRHPKFIKSPNDKSIRAMFYSDGTRLPGPDAIDPNTWVLVGDVVRFDTEVRLHILDGEVVAASRYAENGQLSLGSAPRGAITFGDALISEVRATLPSAIVVDIGLIDREWAVIEANAAWASGHYLSDSNVVLDVILRAASPLSTVSEHDRQFLRHQSRLHLDDNTNGGDLAD